MFISFYTVHNYILIIYFSLEQATKAQMYSSTLPSTSAQDWVGGQCHTPATLLQGKTRYPLYRRLGESQGQSEQVGKILLPLRFDPQTIRPIASHYTDWAIPAYFNYNPVLVILIFVNTTTVVTAWDNSELKHCHIWLPWRWPVYLARTCRRANYK